MDISDYEHDYDEFYLRFMLMLCSRFTVTNLDDLLDLFAVYCLMFCHIVFVLIKRFSDYCRLGQGLFSHSNFECTLWSFTESFKKISIMSNGSLLLSTK